MSPSSEMDMISPLFLWSLFILPSLSSSSIGSSDQPLYYLPNLSLHTTHASYSPAPSFFPSLSHVSSSDECSLPFFLYLYHSLFSISFPSSGRLSEKKLSSLNGIADLMTPQHTTNFKAHSHSAIVSSDSACIAFFVCNGPFMLPSPLRNLPLFFILVYFIRYLFFYIYWALIILISYPHWWPSSLQSLSPYLSSLSMNGRRINGRSCSSQRPSPSRPSTRWRRRRHSAHSRNRDASLSRVAVCERQVSNRWRGGTDKGQERRQSQVNCRDYTCTQGETEIVREGCWLRRGGREGKGGRSQRVIIDWFHCRCCSSLFGRRRTLHSRTVRIGLVRGYLVLSCESLLDLVWTSSLV